MYIKCDEDLTFLWQISRDAKIHENVFPFMLSVHEVCVLGLTFQ